MLVSCSSLSPSERLSKLVGTVLLEFVSPASLPCAEAIATDDEVAIRSREAEVGRSEDAVVTSLALSPPD